MSNLNNDDYDDGYNAGMADLKATIADMMIGPPTDDPTDLLFSIGQVVELEHRYDYFNDKGEWVAYPND